MLEPPRIAIDAQPLQSPTSRGRGIGRYVLDLITELSMADGQTSPFHSALVNSSQGIVPDLIPLIHASLIHPQQRMAPLDAAGQPPNVYLSTTLFDLALDADTVIPRWARAASIRTAGVVFDLIPARFPEHYLGEQETRSRYWARLEAARRLDTLLCISDATRHDVIELLDLPAERVVTIGTGISGGFHPASDRRTTLASLLRDLPGLRPGFILYTGGMDFRKNMEGALEAFARLKPDLRHRHQLVVTCRLGASERQAMVAEARRRGIEDDVFFTGFVPDRLLCGLYQTTELFVFPSLYEGFGLPIVEAITSGAPAVVSDRSSMREIVRDPNLRFDPENPDEISLVIARMLESDDRQAIADQQRRSVDAEFRWSGVAERLLDALSPTGTPSAPPTRRHTKPEIAIVTPVPPQASGIADYSWRLGHSLAELASVTLVVADPSAKAAATASERVGVVTLEEFFDMDARCPFGAVVYMMGNSEFHDYAFDAMVRRPGAVLAHEARFSGFFGWYSNQNDLGPEWFKRLLHQEYRALDPTMGDHGWIAWQDSWHEGVHMLGPIIDRSTQVLTTSPYTAAIAHLCRPRRASTITCIGFGYPEPAPRPPPQNGHAVIGTLGTQAEIKGTDLVIEAFGLLEGHPDSRLHIIGTVDPSYEDTLRVIAERLGVEDRVAILGHVDAGAYEEAIAGIDVAVQLRRGTNGEVSAAVGDCLRRGVPTIVTDLGPNHDLPDDVVVKVPVDVDASGLAEAIDTVLSDTEGRDRLAHSAISYVEAHDFDWAAEALLRAVLPAFASGDPKPAGPPETIENGGIQKRPARQSSTS